MYLRCHKPSQIRSLEEGYNRTLSVPSLGPRSFATSWHLLPFLQHPAPIPAHPFVASTGLPQDVAESCPGPSMQSRPSLSIVTSNYTPFYPLLSRLPASSDLFKHTHTPAVTRPHSQNPPKLHMRPPTSPASVLFTWLRPFRLLRRSLPILSHLAATVLTLCTDILPSDTPLDPLYY